MVLYACSSVDFSLEVEVRDAVPAFVQLSAYGAEVIVEEEIGAGAQKSSIYYAEVEALNANLQRRI